jgi:hypothetical protein
MLLWCWKIKVVSQWPYSGVTEVCKYERWEGEKREQETRERG